MYSASQKIMDHAALGHKLALWRKKDYRIVFTNGCFDLLHPGHTTYLEQARQLGDKLVLGLNTDASVRRLKPNRPVQHQDARAQVLAMLWCTDAIVLFDEDTPLTLINLVRPNVLVKGGDYTTDTIVGAKEVLAWGGAVQTIPLVPGYSTTAIVNHILQHG